MFNPAYVTALIVAAQFIVDHLNQKNVLVDNFPGYLVVTNKDLHVLVIFHVAPRGLIVQNEDVQLVLKNRCLRVSDQVGPDGHIRNGVTSSDVHPMFAGAVGAKELIMSYASSSTDYLADEAIMLMIAVKAGLLARNKVWESRCDPTKPGFNTHLLDLMRMISWTE